jgi:hypothetical protein
MLRFIGATLPTRIGIKLAIGVPDSRFTIDRLGVHRVGIQSVGFLREGFLPGTPRKLPSAVD